MSSSGEAAVPEAQTNKLVEAEPSAPPLERDEAEPVTESGDGCKPTTATAELEEISTSAMSSNMSNVVGSITPGIRATVGIDIDSKMPIFRGTERVSLKNGGSEQGYGDGMGLKSSGDGGMQVKDYFANFDCSDAVFMMNPYMSACANLLDIEYLLSSLLEMKMLKPEDGILQALETHMESIISFVSDVGLEPAETFKTELQNQSDLDAVFSNAQESVVVDSMSTSGKMFAAAISAKRRREAVMERMTKAAAEAAAAANAGDAGDTHTNDEPTMDDVCLAAEYFTKLFKKLSADDSSKNLALLCLLIDKISTLTGEISKSQPARGQEILAKADFSTEMPPEAVDYPEDEDEAPPKYTPLTSKEILSTVGELLPRLISERQPSAGQPIPTHAPPSSSASFFLGTNAINTISQRLVEKHLMRVPEEERMTAEAAAFVNKYGDAKAAVQALVMLSDELNDYLSRLLTMQLDEQSQNGADEDEDEDDEERLLAGGRGHRDDSDDDAGNYGRDVVHGGDDDDDEDEETDDGVEA